MNIGMYLLALLWGFGASFCYALIFNADFKDLFWAALTGSIGWTLYIFLSGVTETATLAYFSGAFCVGILAELFAVCARTPATVFLIPGLIPLVPGGGLFQTMRAVVQGDMSAAAHTGFTALSAAGAIVFGMALASSFAHIVFMIFKYIKLRKHR
ncbi:threonine/serine exporter family protein [Treponema sp. OMZ 840]|uniref:threonine/serine exporter family protein n=1 Tax=Treponema sp. OMZ 840 TaxID=244313 RepID=UPI003D8F4A1E